MACSLLFTPAAPGIDGDGGTPADASRPADAAPICQGEGFRWTHQLPIAFTGLGDPQDNVPVGIRFTPSDFASLQLPDEPSSLHFSEAGTPMAHEVEAWNPDLGGLVWVLVDSYPGDGDVLGFDMFFGDPLATSSEKASEVWLPAGYSAVFHFNRGDFKDSLGPSSTADIADQIMPIDINAGGGFGHAMRFPGLADQTVSLPHSPNHQSEETLIGVSIEAHFRATHASAQNRFVIQKPGAYSISSSTTTDDLSLASLSVAAEADEEVTSPGAVLSSQDWTHAAMTVAPAAKPLLRYFLDGVAVGEPAGFLARATSTEPLIAGSSFQGDMDELRISDQVRPDSWHALQTALFTGSLQSLGTPIGCAP